MAIYTYPLEINYCTHAQDTGSVSGGSGTTIATVVDEYVGYNSRHQPTLQLTREMATETPGYYQITTTMTLRITVWSWFGANTEHTQGVSSSLYRYEDSPIAEVTIIASAEGMGASGNSSLYATEFLQEVRSYGSGGRLAKITKETYSGSKLLNVASLITQLLQRKLSDTSPVFPTTTFSWFWATDMLGMELSEQEIHTYTRLSAGSHSIRVDKYAATDVMPERTTSNYMTIASPIPRLQRISRLDPSRYCITSLEESGEAAAARYNNWLYNNAYVNLNAGAIGLVQYMGAAEADYLISWEGGNINFNDIKTLHSSLLRYVGLLGALTAQDLGIRYQYSNYAAALIKWALTRGNHTTNYGVHGSGKYPWMTQILNRYTQHLGTVFDLIRVELGANDSSSTLRSLYSSIGSYIQWMSGSTSAIWYIPKLGSGHAANVNTRLSEAHKFRMRYCWAEIDRGLAEAFLSDSAMTGHVSLADPLAIKGKSPGSPINVKFMGSSRSAMITGIDVVVDTESISCSLQLKQQLTT